MDTTNPFSSFEEPTKLPDVIAGAQMPENMQPGEVAAETEQLAGNVVAMRARASGYPQERRAA